MKILIFSPMGDACGLAQQLSQEGHQIHLWIEGENYRPAYDGLVYKSENWWKDAFEVDVVFFDSNGHGDKADMLRDRGRKVWGGGVLADRLENDRAFGMKVMEKSGLRVPETLHFSTAAEARKIAEGSDWKKGVIKLNTDKYGKDTSFVASSQEELVAVIEQWEEKDPRYFEKGGIVQEFIKGVEISVEGWFDGEEFLYPFNVTMEDKKLLNDDCGPNTGCAQNVVLQLRPKAPKIARQMLLPLIPTLKGKFIGPIDVNMIVSSEGEAYALEFTPRAGYDAAPTLTLGLPGYGEAMSRALKLSTCKSTSDCDCDGEECRCLVCGAERPPFWFLGSVRGYLPPYPFDSGHGGSTVKDAYALGAGVEIRNWTLAQRRVVLYDAKTENGKIVTAGTCGIPLIALGHGPTIEDMAEDVYKHLAEVSVANLCYRTDLGKRARREWKKIEHLLS